MTLFAFEKHDCFTVPLNAPLLCPAVPCRASPSELRKQYRLVVSTACVLFHRFFAFHSFRKHNRFVSGWSDVTCSGEVA